jgi:hypothetical protein
MLGIYLAFGIVFHIKIITKHTRIKTKLPMWAVHFQVVVLWLPIILNSLGPEDPLEKALNISIKDSGIITPLPGIEMPGKEG